MIKKMQIKANLLLLLIKILIISQSKCDDEFNSTTDHNFNSSIANTDVEQKSTTKEWEKIDGCPDYASFNSNLTTEIELSKITCICGPYDINLNAMVNENGISVNCIYGSTLRDLKNALTSVKKANKVVKKITLSGILLSENSTDSLIWALRNMENINLKSLEVKTCHGGIPLRISHPGNEAPLFKLSNLEYLTIEYCDLEEVPKELIRYSKNIKEISLSNNKIKNIRVDEIEEASKSLEYLNLEGNLLNNVEEGALSQLSELRILHIGEHNYASQIIVDEIEKIPQLTNLDMTRMDGIDENKNFASKTLKSLTLTGCNFKKINADNFKRLPSLEMLDLRVNLIEYIASKCFANLKNLKRLNLAGNFLRHINESDVWNGLESIEYIDLGWNDFKKINTTTFNDLNKEIKVIDLRHNEKLKMIEDNVFTDFSKLLFLNLSHSALTEIRNETFTAINLKTLDISFNNISVIDSGAFDKFKESIQYINISGNKLTGIPKNSLTNLSQLKELDISENPWICDDSLNKARNIINEIYKMAAVNSTEFELKNEKKTTCDRPYAHRGTSIFELKDEKFNYDKNLDVTEKPTTTTPSIELNDITENTTNFNWQQISIQIGEEMNTLGTIDLDAGKPTYDINSIRYGQRSYKKLSNTWLSGVIVTILILLTAVCIILIVRRKKTKMVKDDITCTATSTEL